MNGKTTLCEVKSTATSGTTYGGSTGEGITTADHVSTTVISTSTLAATTALKELYTASATTAALNGTTVNSSSSCLCSCGCTESATSKISPETLDQMVAELVVAKNGTSQRKRKLTSASDTRSSSRGIGAIGVILIVVVIGVFVVPDINIIIIKLSKCAGRRKVEV